VSEASSGHWDGQTLRTQLEAEREII
jgi:hypothetical protein